MVSSLVDTRDGLARPLLTQVLLEELCEPAKGDQVNAVVQVHMASAWNPN